jgi:hypothetical protein
MYSLRSMFKHRGFARLAKTVCWGKRVLSAALRPAVLASPVLCVPFASPAYAGDVTNGKSDPSSSASTERCFPLAQVKGSIENQGGRLIEMTPEQFQFARGMFVVTPPESAKLPPGDHAMIGEMPNGDVGVIFVDGDSACDVAVLGAPAKQLLMAVGSGSFTHIGDGV